MAPRKPIKPTSKTESKRELKSGNKKREEKTKSNEPGFWDKARSFVTDERLRFIAGILLLIGVLYFLLAFISYFFTGAADQSKMDLPFSELRQLRTEIQNWTSVTGALIAETLIHRWFGVSSFAMLFFAGIIKLKKCSK